MMKIKPNYTMIKNKVAALILISIGVIPMFLDCDATFFLFSSSIGTGLFFSKDKIIDF